MSETQQATSLTDLLNQLEPVPVPPAVSMVPQTVGWLVLAAVFLTLLVFAIWRWHQHRQATAHRRAALVALSQVGDDRAAIAEILRRTALVSFPRAQVAGLTGADWAAFLDQSYGGNGFASATGQALLSAPYTGSAPDAQATTLARDWIKRHKAEGGRS
ncbi:DUF4381 domain-containing protein [Tropicibacter sp. R16_0]|uniref:DUF4381 domain-containing protein n=1 Tax=Tropicibacter sp. R16_0 TaxID=2821102 RepID=UPI001ADA7194|nr:DUF4381 domain-containing protein [Tropicibacter sp. R16_0]MBO9449757.1 DUF4381 domain-containing protein [Tropicibacter sp. R16_0]